MRGSYAYSFDRETFHGNHKTRDEAFRAALTRVDLVGPDLVVYVGQRMGGDTQAAGHAKGVIAEMRRRAKENVGETSRDFLRNLTPDQIKDLDGALETAIDRWLGNYKLAPRFDKIGAISEHALPNSPQVASDADETDTVTTAFGDIDRR